MKGGALQPRPGLINEVKYESLQELTQLPRTRLLGTWLYSPFADAPELTYWHHALVEDGATFQGAGGRINAAVGRDG